MRGAQEPPTPRAQGSAILRGQIALRNARPDSAPRITFTTCRPSLPNGCSPVHLEIRSWDKTLSAGSLEHFEPCLTACATGTWRKTIVCSTVPCKRRSWLDRKERRSLLHRWTQNLALPSEASHDAHNVMLAALQLWFSQSSLAKLRSALLLQFGAEGCSLPEFA